VTLNFWPSEKPLWVVMLVLRLGHGPDAA